MSSLSKRQKLHRPDDDGSTPGLLPIVPLPATACTPSAAGAQPRPLPLPAPIIIEPGADEVTGSLSRMLQQLDAFEEHNNNEDPGSWSMSESGDEPDDGGGGGDDGGADRPGDADRVSSGADDAPEPPDGGGSGSGGGAGDVDDTGDPAGGGGGGSGGVRAPLSLATVKLSDGFTFVRDTRFRTETLTCRCPLHGCRVHRVVSKMPVGLMMAWRAAAKLPGMDRNHHLAALRNGHPAMAYDNRREGRDEARRTPAMAHVLEWEGGDGQEPEVLR